MCCKKSRIDDSWIVDEVHIFVCNTSLRVCGPGGGFRRPKQLPDVALLWPQSWSGMSKAARKEKQERAVGKPKIDNARRARGIYSVDPEHGELQRNHQNARQSVEILMEAAMPCKMETKKRLTKLRATVSESDESKKI